MRQLEIFQFDNIEIEEMREIHTRMRNAYWHIRNTRKGKFGQARIRKAYRLVEKDKKKLLLAGVPKRAILDLICCFRLQCPRNKQPFGPCPYCPGQPITKMLPNI